MRMRFWIGSTLAAVLLAGATLPAVAQIGLPRLNPQRPDDQRLVFKIKRRTVNGTVKALDAERKTLVLLAGQKDVPIDVGPAIIHAGNGLATFGDLKEGDKLSVYGETTVQGGVRAMTIQAPKERKSVEIPKKNAKLTPEEKAKVKEAQVAAKEAEKQRQAEEKAAAAAKKEADRLKREEEKKAREEEKKAREEEKRKAREEEKKGEDR